MGPEEIHILSNQYILSTYPNEMRMSHWVKNLQLKRVKDNRILLDLFNSSWHLDTYQEKENRLLLIFQKYPQRTVDYIFELDFDLNEVYYRDSRSPLDNIHSLLY